ncbi:uracil-DNA glycosylase [Sphingomonas sp. SRS2]|uniref:uracil-DNA glycosylase n=1 Tax=Sphingomonas sp. SRS2 TaxID=133190 RepID=UPI00061845A3|nr:uracil-DNA glycosylase [Sphingomonas sp. SRS2]KKC27065.1 uracil-DNA glycosylase [Sphingomonas sp. SRS2]
MVLGGNIESSEAFSSLVTWWQDAGLDVLVDETPRDWLTKVDPAFAAPVTGAAPAPAEAPRAAPVAATPAAAKPAFPDSLPAFQAWLAGSEKLSIPLAARVAAAGDPASGAMVLVDLPEAEDHLAGKLLSGAAGQLFDKMVAAIGRGRDSLYLAAMAPGRPAGGYVDKASGALFGELARHHVALARPRILLLMGEQPSRAFLNMGFVEARGRVHDVSLAGGAVPAIATFHPRTLLQHPEQKRRAWEDLQLLMKALG